MHAAYEQQWLILAEEYHDHLRDMHTIPGMAGPGQAALKPGGGKQDDWKVQIFRYGQQYCAKATKPSAFSQFVLFPVHEHHSRLLAVLADIRGLVHEHSCKGVLRHVQCTTFVDQLSGK